MLGLSRLRRRSAYGAAGDTSTEKEGAIAPESAAPNGNGKSGNGSTPGMPPVVSSGAAGAPGSLPVLPAAMRDIGVPKAVVPPPPQVRVTEDEDTVIGMLFPQNVPMRVADAVPVPPTAQLAPKAEEAIGAVRELLAPAERQKVAEGLGLPGGVPVVAAAKVGQMPVVDADAHPTAHLHEREFSESDLAVDVEPDGVALSSTPVAAKSRRNVFSALLVIGHLLLLNALSIPVSMIIMKRLGALGYGQWLAATELVTLSGLMTTLGLRPLFVRAIAQKPELAEEELSYQLGLRALLTLGACTLAIGVVFGFHYRFPHEYTPTVIICVAIAVFSMALNVMSLTLQDLLQGLHRMKMFSAINFVSGILSTAATLFVAWKYPDPISLSLAYITTPLVGLILYWFAIRRHVSIRVRFSLSKSREMLRESRTIGAYQISVVVRDRLERVMLPWLSGMKRFGFYGAGVTPADRLFAVPEGFITAFFPAISRSYHEDEKSASHHVLHLMVTSVVACAPLAILVTYLAEPIARILFPTSPELCRDVIRITIWAVPLKGLQLPMGCALQASGRHATAAKTGIAATFFSLALTIPLIVFMGIRGACWAFVGRAAISALFLVPAFVQTFPNVYPRVPMFRILLGLAMMGGLLYGATQVHLHLQAWLTLTLGACAAVMVYFLAMILMRVIEVSDLKMMMRRRTAE